MYTPTARFTTGGIHVFTFGDGIILHLIGLACAANTRHDLCGTEDDVDAAICADNVAHLSGLECIGGVLERLLHHARPEPAEVAVARVRGAVRVLVRERPELGRVRVDLGDVALEDLDRLLARARDVVLGRRQRLLGTPDDKIRRGAHVIAPLTPR